MRHNENLECDPHGGHALLGDVRAEIGGPTPPQRATMAVVLPWSAIGGLASTIALVPDGTRKLVVQCGKRYPSTWREWRCGKGALTREHYSRWFMKASWAPFHSHGWLVEVVLGPRMGWLRHGCFFFPSLEDEGRRKVDHDRNSHPRRDALSIPFADLFFRVFPSWIHHPPSLSPSVAFRSSTPPSIRSCPRTSPSFVVRNSDRFEARTVQVRCSPSVVPPKRSSGRTRVT